MRDITSKLQDKINSIPTLPGIYKMLDSGGNILYVGKSKCLKKRVKSYFNKDHQWEKINKLVALICDIDFTVTDTHLEARLLECTLIKTIRPPFNSQMKNDRRYVYLQIQDYNPYNALAVVKERSENTYGPLRSQHILLTLITLLKNLYPISFDGDRYVFEYHLFPVSMDKEDYNCNRKILMDLFSDQDNMNLLQTQLEEKMKEAATSYRYEAASFYRDLIHGLKYTMRGINGYQELLAKRLVLIIPIEEGIKLFYVSKGDILLTKKYRRLTQLPKYVETFIEKGNSIKQSNNFKCDEKAAVDYHDILYSEINSFTDDMVIIID